MKRRQFLKASLLASPAVILSGSVSAHSGSKQTWIMSSAFPETLDALFGTSQFICKTVAEMTNERFTLQLFKPGAITRTKDALNAVSQGVIDMVHSCGHYYTAQNPAFALMSSIPFGLNARQFNAWLYNGKGLNLLNSFHEKHNLIAFPAGNAGPVMGGWYKREIKTIDDFKDLKIHTSGLTFEIMNRLGASSQSFEINEIFGELERGTIEASESMGPYNDEKIGFSRIAPYYYYPGWMSGCLNTAVYINKEKWDGLSHPYQEALEIACRQAQSQMLAQYDNLNPSTINRLISAGARFSHFSPEILQACHLTARNYYADIGVRNEDFRNIFSPMQAFRDEAYSWQQISDFSYDQFMLRHIINKE